MMEVGTSGDNTPMQRKTVAAEKLSKWSGTVRENQRYLWSHPPARSVSFKTSTKARTFADDRLFCENTAYIG
jgi:hypothetical protein